MQGYCKVIIYLPTVSGAKCKEQTHGKIGFEVQSSIERLSRQTIMSQSPFCNQCGTRLPSGSRFCNGCGATVATSSAVTPRLSDPAMHRGPMAMEDEQTIFVLRPTMIFVYFWYAIAAAVLILASALTAMFGPEGWTALYIIVGIGLLGFLIPIYKHIMRRREVYTLTNFKLEMRYGLIAKDVRNIPLSKIQDVTVSRSVWQRLLGLGDIIIDSASETGRIHLNDIHNPDYYADQILATLRRWN